MRAIVTLGEPLGTLAATRPGRLAVGSELTLSVAGAEVNVAIALARLGIPVWFAGAVGTDSVGSIVRQVLRAEGVEAGLLEERPARRQAF